MSRESVHEEAKILDKIKPGWFRKINPETLDLDSLTDCTLGQVFGHVERGRHALRMGWPPTVLTMAPGMPERDAHDRFMRSYCLGVPDDEEGANYHTNEEAWIEEVKHRFNEGVQA